MENKKSVKKELKVVFSDEIYDELKYVFRPDRLENVIYAPAMREDGKWLCSCGFETDLGMCPICGMEKATVFSKVNANYLARHRKDRLAHKQRSSKRSKEALAAGSVPSVGAPAPVEGKGRKIGTIAGVIVLLAAIAVSGWLLFRKNPTTEPRETDDTAIPHTSEIDTSGSGNETNTPETNVPETNVPETSVPETDSPETTPVKVNDSLSVKVVDSPYEFANTTAEVSTVAISGWPEGASGNVAMGGLVYTASDADYLVKNGISAFDKEGRLIKQITDTEAKAVDGCNDYLFFTDTDNKLRRVTYDGLHESLFDIGVDKFAVYDGKLFYTPYGSDGLYATDFDGGNARRVSDRKITALNATAGKLYFSTPTGLGVLTAAQSNVTYFAPDAANATSVLELDGSVFYTVRGLMSLYNPKKASGFGRVYPGDMLSGEQFTAMAQYEDRLYFRVETAAGTRWYSMTALFRNIKPTEVTTPSLFVTDQGYYDGELNYYKAN